MPSGVQIWDSSGNLIVDITDRLMRIHATVSISSANSSGSTTVSTLGQGDFIYFFLTSTLGGSPTISLSGTTVSWTAVDTGFVGTLFIGTY